MEVTGFFVGDEVGLTEKDFVGDVDGLLRAFGDVVGVVESVPAVVGELEGDALESVGLVETESVALLG